MRRVDLLITQARRDSNNIEFTDTTGLSDDDFIAYANRAQDRLQSLLQQVYPDILQKEKEVDVVQNQEEYSVPSDAYLEIRTEQIDYSPTGKKEDYYTLDKGRLRERFSGNASNPFFYIRRSKTILLQPKPQQGGKLRITYQKQIPRLDKRRGTIQSVTTSGNQITSLVLDPTVNIDDQAMLNEGYITIIDKDGNVKMRSIPITGVNVTSGIVTVESGFEFEDGESAAAGQYVCSGAFASTNSELPDTCERYISEYMVFRAQRKDSNNDALEQSADLKAIEDEIVASFSVPDRAITKIPIIDDTYLTTDDSYTTG